MHEQIPTAIDSADEWAHHLSYPGTDGVRSVAFSPDGQFVYVHVHAPAINVWAVGVHHWPELLSGVLALLTLVLLLRAWRIRRRPQSSKVPYCRRCNYNLSAHVRLAASGGRRRFEAPSGAVCPECGADLASRPPRRGRNVWRRLAVVGSIWLIAGLPLLAMVVLKVPRDGSTSRKVNWSSRWLADVAQKRNVGFLARWIGLVDQVLEVETSSGRTVRTVVTSTSPSHSHVCVSPDGRWLFLTSGGSYEITRYRLTTGRKFSSINLPEASIVDVGGPSIIGFSPDGRAAYVQWLNREQAVGGVSRWDLETDRVDVLVTTPAYVDEERNRGFAHGRHFLVRGAFVPPRFISRPDFMEAYPTKIYKVRRHSSGDPASPEFEISPLPDSTGVPVLTLDGRFMFVSAQYGQRLVVIDVEEGKISQIIPLRMDNPLSYGRLAISVDGTILAGSSARGVRLFDVRRKQWIASLEVPDGLYGAESWFSPDNRWLAAACQKGSGKAGQQFTHELVLWDLNRILSDRAAAAASPAAEPSVDSGPEVVDSAAQD